MTLTAKKVAKLKEPGRYSDGARSGLYLQIQSPTNRSWLLRYERAGRERWMGLGPLHLVSLKLARERTKAARLLLLDGIDPIDHRSKVAEARAVEAAKDKTFAEVAAAYLRTHRGDWTNPKHASQWKTSLTKECRAIANLPIAAINTTHVLEVLEPIWRVKPETASRTRGRIERVLAYAIAAEYRKREDGNPARWDGHLQELLGSKAKAQKAKRDRAGKSEHHSALPYTEIPAFMAALRARDSVSARALEFLILACGRTREVIGARWDEIDLAAKTWAVPPVRMKKEKEHIVPLPDRAMEILKKLPREGAYLFVGGTKGAPLSNMAMLELLRGMRTGLTVHGFRSSFRDWAGDRTRFDHETIEFSLAHGINDKTEAAYRRGTSVEKRRRLMAEWARFCASLPAAAKDDVVVAMRSAR
jgi:integrase